LKLAPLKAEIIHLRPQLIIYRQAVTEIESEIITNRVSRSVE